MITRKIIAALALTSAIAAHAELVQQFRDPTFSGNGWSSQVLTLEQMRQSAKQQEDAKKAADIANAQAAANNTPLAKFMSLFTGQVYSQLATQLTNNLFSSNSCKPSKDTPCTGSFNVSDTQQIVWQKNADANGNPTTVTLNVFSGKMDSTNTFVATNPNKPDTSIIVPISSFAF